MKYDPAGRLMGAVAPPPRGGGKRGITSPFSAGSRRRLNYRLDSILDMAVAWGQAAGLTYGGPVETLPSSTEIMKDLACFRKSFRRAYPDAAVVWRLEYDPNTRPHFHLLTLGAPPLARETLMQMWLGLDRGPAHRQKGAYVQPVRSVQGYRAYMAKYQREDYMPDPQGERAHRGRFWGDFGPVELYLGEEQQVELTEEEWRFLRDHFDETWRERARQIPDPRKRQACLAAIDRLIAWRSDATGFSYCLPSSLVEEYLRQLELVSEVLPPATGGDARDGPVAATAAVASGGASFAGVTFYIGDPLPARASGIADGGDKGRAPPGSAHHLPLDLRDGMRWQ